MYENKISSNFNKISLIVINKEDIINYYFYNIFLILKVIKVFFSNFPKFKKKNKKI